jgi:hypothetical protein
MRVVKDFLHLRRAFVIAVFLGLFAMAARNVLDPDVWWHLKTGEWIVQHRAVPHTDIFSYTRVGQAWTAHEWLSELAIYGIFRFAGYAGLIVAFAAIISAACIPLYLRCRCDPVTAGAMTAWGALATAVVWGVRPQIFSLLLLSVWLQVLERSEENPKLLLWIPPLTVLWVNLHAGFILGPVFICLFIVGESIEIFLASGRISKPRLRWLSLTLLASLALVPLNPNGASIFWYPVETLRSRAMQSHITEWASPNFHSVDYRALLFLILAAFAALAFSWRRTRPRDLFLLLVGTAAALSSVRMIPLFVLVAVPLLSRLLAKWRGSKSLDSRKTSSSSSALRSAFLSASVLLALLAFTYVHTTQVIQNQSQREAIHFPAAAVAYLQQHPPTGPIFDHYDWGGYLIFKLYPENRVFIDGRADVYGDTLMRQFTSSYYLQDDWKQPLSQWKVTTVIVPPESALASALGETSQWTLEYQDSIAVIFSKRH